MVNTQALVGEPGAYHLARELPSIQLPATVQAVLAARIDRLPPQEKQRLQTAAVIGTEVPLPLLQAVAGLPEEGLATGLANLQAAEFLYETHFLPPATYMFKHALIQEVAYQSLLQSTRQHFHQRVAHTVGERFPDMASTQPEAVGALCSESDGRQEPAALGCKQNP